MKLSQTGFVSGNILFRMSVSIAFTLNTSVAPIGRFSVTRFGLLVFLES